MNYPLESIRQLRLAPIIFASLGVAAVVAAILWITGFLGGPANPISSANSDSLFQTCVDKAYQSSDRPSSTFVTDRAKYDERVLPECYNRVRSQLLLRDFEIRRLSFQTAQQEGLRMNLVAMIILLFATTSGIILAGLQLLAAFNLMSK
jgi:hypothetical protein